MQSTADATNETSTNFQTANYISENTTRNALPEVFWVRFNSSPFQISFLTITALGVLTNILVLVGFCLAGRSKMNTSSIYIANHATLELLACVNGVLRFTLDMEGKFSSYDASNPGDWIVCLLIQAAVLSGIGNNGGIMTVVIITFERYWKIVHPLHHRKYYRSWMFKLGLILPWLSGIAIRGLPYLATTRIVKGRCLVMVFWASPVMDEVSQSLSRYRNFPAANTKHTILYHSCLSFHSTVCQGNTPTLLLSSDFSSFLSLFTSNATCSS